MSREVKLPQGGSASVHGRVHGSMASRAQWAARLRRPADARTHCTHEIVEIFGMANTNSAQIA